MFSRLEMLQNTGAERQSQWNTRLGSVIKFIMGVILNAEREIFSWL